MTNRIPLIVNPGAAQIQEISSTDVLAVPGTVTANAVQTDNYQYANGQPFSGGGGGSYGDSNVVTLLGDFGSNNVSTAGNVTSGTGLFGEIYLDAVGTNKLLYSDANRYIYDTTFSYDSDNSIISGTGAVSVTGNISGNYILGNGSQLTGLISANIGNFVFDSYTLDSTTFDEITVGEGSSGNILINASGLAMMLAGGESDGMVAGTGNVYLFNGDPTFANGIPQPGVGKIWQFGNDGELYLPTGGSLGPVGKGWTGLGGGNGNPLSLTSYYSDGMYSSCINLNPDGTLYIATYGDGTGQQGNWNFSNANLVSIGNSTISIANATSGLGGNSLTIQAGASDTVTFNGNSGGDLNLVGGYGSFGDGGGGPGGNVNISGGGSSDSTPGNVNINSGSNVNIKTYMGGGLAGVWTFDNTGALTVAGNINGDGASPAPSINGFSSVNAITLSASGNVYGTNFIGNIAGNLVSGANYAGFDPYGDFVLPSSVYVGVGANMGLAISTNSTGATIAAPQTGQNLVFQTNSVGPVYHNLVFDQLGTLSAPGNITGANNIVISGNIGGPGYNAPNFIQFNSTDPGFSIGAFADDVGNVNGNYWVQAQFEGDGGGIQSNRGFRLYDNSANTYPFAVDGTGTAYVPGTVNAGYFVGDGSQLTNIQVSGGSPVSTTGNVSGGNLIATGTVSASGNITANYFFGNGSQLTGIVATEPSFSIQSSNFQASAGNRYGVNTAGGTVTATLPASPGTGNAVFFADAGGAYATNNLIINPNGLTIMGATGNMTVSTNNQSFGLFYNGTTWRTYNAG